MTISLPGLYLFLLMTTQFFFIKFLGGYLRPYHILTVVILALVLPFARSLFRSRVVRWVVLLNLASIISVLASETPGAAAISYALFALNSGAALAIAALFCSERVLFLKFPAWSMRVTVLICLIATLQAAGFRMTGANFGLSEAQNLQIAAGYAPGLFNEANTFAKYLLTPLFFFLPYAVRRLGPKAIYAFYIFLIGCLLLNFMRSALAAAVITGAFLAIWYIRRGGALRLFLQGFVIAVGVGLVWVMFLGSGSGLGSYNVYKIHSLLSLDALQSDGSWQFRAAAMEIAIEQTILDPIRILFGNGWGQVFGYLT